MMRDAICSIIRTAHLSHPDPGQMTMIKLAEGQRAVLVQAFPAVGHLGIGALVFGQFLRQQPFSIVLALAGVGIWIWFVSLAVVLSGGKR
jgi:hypothetical protein